MAVLTARGGALLPHVGHLAEAVLGVHGAFLRGEVGVVQGRGERGDLGATRVPAHR